MGNELQKNNKINEFKTSYENINFFYGNDVNRTWWNPKTKIPKCWVAYLSLRFDNVIPDLIYPYFENIVGYTTFIIFTIDKNKVTLDESVFNKELFNIILDKYSLNEKYRFIPLSIEIKYKNERSSHANMLLLDRKTGKAEYFEPHGKYYDDNEIISNKIYYLIKEWLKINWKEFKIFISPNDLCLNNKGIQTIFDLYQNENTLITIPGHCQAFTLLFIHLRLLMPDIDFSEIIRVINNTENMKAIKEIIYNYFNFISLHCAINVEEQSEKELADEILNNKDIYIKNEKDLQELILCADILCITPFKNKPILRNITNDQIRKRIQEIYQPQRDLLNNMAKEVHKEESININLEFIELKNNCNETIIIKDTLWRNKKQFLEKILNENNPLKQKINEINMIQEFDKHNFVQLSFLDFILNQENYQELTNDQLINYLYNFYRDYISENLESQFINVGIDLEKIEIVEIIYYSKIENKCYDLETFIGENKIKSLLLRNKIIQNLNNISGKILQTKKWVKIKSELLWFWIIIEAIKQYNIKNKIKIDIKSDFINTNSFKYLNHQMEKL
jgi:hypothetical protein